MKRLIISLICLLITINLSYAEDKSFSGSIKVGGSVVDLKDSATLVSEYNKENKNDINPLIEIKGSYDKDAYIDFKAKYIHPENQYYKLKFDGNRVFRFETDYQRFFHITSKDNLSNLWAHAGVDYRDNTTLAPGADGNADPMGVPGFPNVPSTGTTSLGQIGSATVYNSDISQQNSYGKSVTEWHNQLVLNIPSLNGVTFGVKTRFLERKGFDHSTVIGHCSSCHVTGYDKKVDEKTTEVTPFIDGKLGKWSFNYSMNSRDFENKAEQTFLYDRTGSPLDNSNPFRNRAMFDNTDGAIPANIDPDSSKVTNTLKIRYDFSKNANLIITGILSESTNKSTNEPYDLLRGKYGKELESEYKSIDLKYHRKITKNLTFNLRAYYKTQDNDDVFIDVIERTNPVAAPGGAVTLVDGLQANSYNTSTNFPGMGLEAYPNPLVLDFTRHSLIKRDEMGLNFDLNYRLSNYLNLFALLGYDKIERDNAHDYEVTEDTKKYTLKLGANYKPSSTLKTKLAYEYTKTDDPFIYFKAGCAETFSRGDVNDTDGNLPHSYYNVPVGMYRWDALYGPVVYDRRKAGMSIEPTGEHQFDLTINYLPTERLGIDLNGKYKDAKNNDLATYDWKRKIYSANANLNYSVNQDLMLYAGYNYLREKYDSILCASYYDG